MKICISNLAWKPEEEKEVFKLLKSEGTGGIEIAPGKVFAEPANAATKEVEKYKKITGDAGLKIVAFQAFLFGHPELQMFKSEAVREELKKYIVEIIKLAKTLGAGVLVYGAPKSRDRGELSTSQAMNIAIPFFKEVGEIALKNGTVFCIEPNPEEYGCNFIINSKEGAELVDAVNSKGFGLHLDTAGMYLASEDAESALIKNIKLLKHFHVSEPNLANLNSPKIDHEKIGRTLNKLEYNNWVSIEMLPSDEYLIAIKNALSLTEKFYGRK